MKDSSKLWHTGKAVLTLTQSADLKEMLLMMMMTRMMMLMMKTLLMQRSNKGIRFALD